MGTLVATPSNRLNIIEQKVKKAYFARRNKDIIEYETAQETYTVKKGDYLGKIAKKKKTTVSKLKKDNNLTSDAVKIGDSLTIETKKEKGRKISFEKLDEANLGDEVYIIVETEYMHDKEIKMSLKQGGETKVLTETRKAIYVTQDDKEVEVFKATVGEFTKNNTNISNAKDFINCAIAKITLAPKDDNKNKTYQDTLEKAKNKKALMYLVVDAEPNGLIEVVYDFFTSNYENVCYEGEGRWFELKKNQSAPWMEIAWKEYKDWSEGKWTEKKDDGLKRANKYIKKAGDSFKANKKAWCGCFIHWVLTETNNTKKSNFSTVTNNPTSSQNYWEKSRYPNSKKINPSLESPPYGVITVLHKTGWSGHVGFLINFEQKENKTYAYLLGGNQNNKVCVQEFLVYKEGATIIYETKSKTKYKLKGYVYPEEFKINNNEKYKNNYKITGYTIEEAISTN